MKEAAYQKYMKNTRLAQAEREAAAAAAHAAESAERAAKQKGHTHVPPEAPRTTGGTTNAPPSKPALQRMSTQAIQAKVKSKWAFRAAVAGLIFALPSLHVVPMVWTGYLWSRSVKGMSFLHALASVDTNAQCDTGAQTFLYWTALLSLFLNVNRLLCRGVLPCLDSNGGSSQEGKEEEDTFRFRNGCVSGCECALSPFLFCLQIYGMFQVYGTNQRDQVRPRDVARRVLLPDLLLLGDLPCRRLHLLHDLLPASGLGRHGRKRRHGDRGGARKAAAAAVRAAAGGSVRAVRW